MSIKFTWLEATEEFDPVKVYFETEDILSVEIIEKEGCRPRAIIQILNHAKLSQRLIQKRLMVISQDEKVLFKGILGASIPSHLEGSIVTLNFEVRSTTEKEKLEKLSLFLRQNNSYDPFLYGDLSTSSFQDLLESSNHLLYWDRVTGTLQLSDLFKGSKFVSLENNDQVFAHPFSMTYSHPPLKSIEIELIANWMHTRQGYVDLTPFIESKFTGGRINTLSGLSLAQSWWQEGTSISSTKYWIASSDIQEITPTYSNGNSGCLRLCKIKSSDNSSPHILKRYWYKANLILGWNYLQPRREIAIVRLNNAHQLTSQTDEKVRKIRINLRNLGASCKHPVWKNKHRYIRDFVVQQAGKYYKCLQTHTSSKINFENDLQKWSELKANSPALNELSTATFFETDRGKAVINAALDLGTAHLGHSTRCLELKFELPFDIAQALTCDHSVQLKHPELKNTLVTGKIKQLKLSVNGDRNSMWGEVTLGVSIGSPSLNSSPLISINEENLDSAYFEEGYLLSSETQETTPTNIVYQMTGKSEQQGLGTTLPVTIDQILEAIQIHNSAEDQLKILTECEGDERDLLKLLRKNLTDISIHLKPLEVKGILTRHFEVNGVIDYSAPQQITL